MDPIHLFSNPYVTQMYELFMQHACTAARQLDGVDDESDDILAVYDYVLDDDAAAASVETFCLSSASAYGEQNSAADG